MKTLCTFVCMSLIAMVFAVSTARADTDVVLQLSALHIGITKDINNGENLEWFTPGVGLRFNRTITIGGYRNSFGKFSPAISAEYPIKSIGSNTLGIRAGLAKYDDRILPMISGFVEHNHWRGDLVFNMEELVHDHWRVHDYGNFAVKEYQYTDTEFKFGAVAVVSYVF